jgi:ribonuclease HI
MGGLIRDEEDPWLHDFIGRKTIMEAELQAIRLGLELTWSLDRDQVTVTTDSFEALI